MIRDWKLLGSFSGEKSVLPLLCQRPLVKNQGCCARFFLPLALRQRKLLHHFCKNWFSYGCPPFKLFLKHGVEYRPTVIKWIIDKSIWRAKKQFFSMYAHMGSGNNSKFSITVWHAIGKFMKMAIENKIESLQCISPTPNAFRMHPHCILNVLLNPQLQRRGPLQSTFVFSLFVFSSFSPL